MLREHGEAAKSCSYATVMVQSLKFGDEKIGSSCWDFGKAHCPLRANRWRHSLHLTWCWWCYSYFYRTYSSSLCLGCGSGDWWSNGWQRIGSKVGYCFVCFGCWVEIAGSSGYCWTQPTSGACSWTCLVAPDCFSSVRSRSLLASLSSERFCYSRARYLGSTGWCSHCLEVGCFC